MAILLNFFLVAFFARQLHYYKFLSNKYYQIISQT